MFSYEFSKMRNDEFNQKNRNQIKNNYCAKLDQSGGHIGRSRSALLSMILGRSLMSVDGRKIAELSLNSFVMTKNIEYQITVANRNVPQ